MRIGKYWVKNLDFRLAARVSKDPKGSVFEDLRMRLSNQGGDQFTVNQ